MRAIIIDDERPARSEMKRLLKLHPKIEIVGEAATSDEALQLIKASAPDLLFLDVQLRGDTGFDLLARLKGQWPKVIFATAYDEYAVRAFEVNALDYLLKPVEPVRLAEALLRISNESESEPPQPGKDGVFTVDDRVFIRTEERCWFVPVREIRMFESEGNYTRVFFGKEKPLLYRSLNSLAERLPKTLFFRANRSQIVNLTSIDNVENWFSGNLKIRLREGEEVEISRRQSIEFRERNSL